MFLKTEERPAGEVQEVRKLKLSEAIRIGARMREQAFGYIFHEGKSCALGAALEGSGKLYLESYQPSQIYNGLSALYGRDLVRQIWQMNDHKGESRESIADWLESQGL